MHEGRHAEMLAWYRKLIHLRRTSPSLNDGDLGHITVAFDEGKRWLTMDRGLVKVLSNLGESPAEFQNPEHLPLLLASRDGVQLIEDKALLPPDTLAILSGETR
jgi:maltooligosyltrehalose trehalohydrolase